MIDVRFILIIYFSLIFYIETFAGYAVILIYHKFDEPDSPSTSISTQIFYEQMKYLKENNYNVVSIDKLLEYIEKKNIPEKTVVITIDDGYKSTIKAFNILKKFNFPFTVFLYMEGINRYPDYLTLKQIEEMKKYGKVTFGNHSYSHRRLARPKEKKEEYIERIIKDTKRAECRFKKLLGFKPNLYAYPYGEYNEVYRSVIEELGYKAAFTQDPASTGVFIDRYIIPRQPIVGNWATMKHFKKILNTEPLNVKPVNPPIGFLKSSLIDNFKAILNTEKPEIYTDCQLYITEHGWFPVKKEGRFLTYEDVIPIRKLKNRVGIKCKNQKTGRFATFFYMILKKER